MPVLEFVQGGTKHEPDQERLVSEVTNPAGHLIVTRTVTRAT